MKKFFFAICFLVCLIATLKCSAQKNKYTTRSSSAIKHFEKAEEFYDKRNDTGAIYELEQAIEADSMFIEAHILLAGVYSDNGKIPPAIREYKKAISIDPEYFTNLFYSLAVLQLQTGKYEDSYKNFQKFLSYPTKNSGLLQKTKSFIPVCEFGMEAVKHPVPFKAVPLGDSINTKNGEYSPAITADERVLFFCRMKPNSAEERINEDIFMSEKVNGKWMMAHGIGRPVNTEMNEGNVTIAPDGQTLYFAASGRPGGFGQCDVYEVKRIGNHWSEPHSLGAAVNTNYFEGQPSIASDGRTLYFVSNRPGGIGNADIWMTYKKENGEWTAPVNLGPTINTKGFEESPFIHPDNSTLYFSSNGHPGLGLNDFFYSRKSSNGAWQKPVNLGYPINTWANERNFIVNAKGDMAFLSSDRDKEKDDFDLYATELYPEARPIKTSYLKGKVFDKETGKSLEAKFDVIDLESGSTITQSFSNKENGEFLVCLPADKNYALNVSSPGYLFYSDNFALKISGTNSEDSFNKDVPLQPVKIGESVILKNIFFETNSFVLKEESKVELQKLISFLTSNPALHIQISGHTDNDGDAKLNQVLSENRARSVYDYLVAHEIAAARLSYKGYGETKPIASNATPEGKSQNRRTEFKITE